jgi:DNA repair protein RadC
MEKKVHEGHREKLKQRFLKEGLNAFEDHQVLEIAFILYNSTQRYQ